MITNLTDFKTKINEDMHIDQQGQLHDSTTQSSNKTIKEVAESQAETLLSFLTDKKYTPIAEEVFLRVVIMKLEAKLNSLFDKNINN